MHVFTFSKKKKKKIGVLFFLKKKKDPPEPAFQSNLSPTVLRQFWRQIASVRQ